MKRILILFGLVCLTTGCASGFEKYYTPARSLQAVLASPALVPPPAEPAVYLHSNDMNADMKRMLEDGYAYLGNSSFYGPANRSNQKQAIEQGRKVHAAAVLFKSEYMDTRSGVVPYTVANPAIVSTVNTSGTVNAYGSTGNYSATSTVTSPGGNTTYEIPFSVDRNTFYASYWAKLDPNKIRIGLRWVPLNDALRQRLERNTGLVVIAVVRGTPAYRANILTGDVLLRINGQEIIDDSGLRAQGEQFAGQTVIFDIMRGDQPRSISVTLSPK
jgi:hypothetical protein